MRALVVYESMYGNERVIASNIADGLRADYEVTVVPMAGATAELVAGGDLLVAVSQGFLVSSHGTLHDGEASWARRWGTTLGAASKTQVQNAPEGASK